MNYAVILAAGVGQRMRNGGLPKQFLKLMGKPIIIYTLEKFQKTDAVDKIIIVSHAGYVDEMDELVRQYNIPKVSEIVVGGNDRQTSLEKGVIAAAEDGAAGEDIVIIHDGVRPLVAESTINENIRAAKKYGSAVTVRPVTESVVITGAEKAEISDFKRRDITYSLTSPQTFVLSSLRKALLENKKKEEGDAGLPLLDAGMVYADRIGAVHLVKENNANIKITTPEDYYFLKAILELEENKFVFGL